MAKRKLVASQAGARALTPQESQALLDNPEIMAEIEKAFTAGRKKPERTKADIQLQPRLKEISDLMNMICSMILFFAEDAKRHDPVTAAKMEQTVGELVYECQGKSTVEGALKFLLVLDTLLDLADKMKLVVGVDPLSFEGITKRESLIFRTFRWLKNQLVEAHKDVCWTLEICRPGMTKDDLERYDS